MEDAGDPVDPGTFFITFVIDDPKPFISPSLVAMTEPNNRDDPSLMLDRRERSRMAPGGGEKSSDTSAS